MAPIATRSVRALLLSILFVFAVTAGSAHAQPTTCPMTITRATLKTSTVVLRPNGSVRVTAGFITYFPTLCGDAFDPSSGMSLEVRDAGTTSVASSWTPAECVAVRGHVKCQSADRSSTIVFKGEVGASYTFGAKLRHLAIAAPFSAPIAVSVTQGTIDFTGMISTCTSGRSGLRCRYP